MPSHNDINRVQAPIDLAIKMVTEQQDRIFSQILGNDGQQRTQVPQPVEAAIISQLEGDDFIIPTADIGI